MNVNRMFFWALTSAGMFSAAPLLAQDGLPTLTQATELSQQTGVPILAMAGQKT